MRPQPVEVQVDVGTGLPSFQIVGLADAAVLEARERVRSAIRASGFEFPNSRIVVNLAPAPIRKHGTGFDLPIAAAILVACGQAPADVLRNRHLVGELSLSGEVCPVRGLLAHAVSATSRGMELVGPSQITRCSSHLGALKAVPVTRLASLQFPANSSGAAPRCADNDEDASSPDDASPDLADVAGQEMGKRALMIAAVGGHNLLYIGPPGAGKSMLARRLPGILPPLSEVERLQTALIHSVAGLDEGPALRGVRPFRSPHHSTSRAGLVGGGTPPVPGEVSLAHNGVLFLDEMPEFGPATLQSLRQPMEDGQVNLVRAEGRLQFPARFGLVGAANPCPCGYLGTPGGRCDCPPASVSRYRARIGGPILDRMDLAIRIEAPDPAQILTSGSERSTADIRTEVLQAREFARDAGVLDCAQRSGVDLIELCRLTPEATAHLEAISSTRGFSGRAVTKTLRVARTLASMERSREVGRDHVMEAVGYRLGDGGRHD